jgi:4-amino-4-deoxy-L-arabinose transferase-like glycosyltransferase
MQKIKEFCLKVLNNPLYFWGIVVLVYVVARLATWGYPFDSDHWIFYYVGRIWAQGGTMYVAAWDHKPPLIFVFNGLMYLMFGGNIILHRIWLTLLSVVDIALFWQLLKKVLPDLKVKYVDIAAKVGLLFYVFWRNLSQFTSSGNNTENYGLIFLLGMLLSYLSFRKEPKWWKMLISGTCFSVLFYLKGNFLLFGVPIGILLLIDNWKSVRKFFGYGIVFVLPLVIQTGFWVTYFAKKNAFTDFFIASFLFSTKYAKSEWKGDVSSNIVLLLILAVFLVPTIIFSLLYIRDFRKNKTNGTYLLFGMSLLAGLGLTLGLGSFYPYYFEIAMPIFIIIFVYALFNMQGLSIWKRWMIYIVLGMSMFLSYGISMKQLYNTFAGSVKAEATEYQQIAAYIDANTTTSDKVFDYDYGATFYRLANRDSGSRFVSASVLLLEYRDNYGYNFDQEFISDMEQSKAKYVVVYRDKNNIYYQNKPIVDYFDTHYVLDKTFTKFEVLRRRGE